MKKKMVIKDLSVLVCLGMTKKEQSSPQEIQWTVEYSLNIENTSCSDFVCYQLLSQKLENYSKSQKFSSMESMTEFCFKKIKTEFPQIQFLCLRLHKTAPPIPYLKGGVFYEYSDEKT